VSFGIEGEGNLTKTTDTSLEDGTAYTTYVAPESIQNTGSATITADISPPNDNAWTETQFDVTVINTTATG
jgi:hypothetical protein